MILTVTSAISEIHEQYGGDPVPGHTMRRIFDDLALTKKISVTRVGRTRTIEKRSLKFVIDELRSRGWLPEMASAS